MTHWIDDSTLLAMDFFESFRGQLYDRPPGGTHLISLGVWRAIEGAVHQAHPGQAGNVRLQAVGSPYDLFHSQEVRVTDSNLLWENPFAFNHFTFGGHQFWIDGAKHGKQALNVPINNQVVFGIYEDDFNRIQDIQSEYQVNIYIEYET